MLGDANCGGLASPVSTAALEAGVAADDGESEGDNEFNSGEGRGRDDCGDERKDEGDGRRIYGGNRWPRQETLALLKIRSDMDVAFKEASVKGPLWDEVSRKLAELGFHRSAKKCREKFENVFKYHKRTKDGRTGKSDGKTYRFFEQLEAFQGHTVSLSSPPPPPPPPLLPPVTAMSAGAVTPLSCAVPTCQPGRNSTMIHSSASQHQRFPNVNLQPKIGSPGMLPKFGSGSSSSSTSSDEGIHGRRRKKQKLKNFFERKLREVIQKQDDLQRQFLEAIEKKEVERMAKEDSWRMQEVARINREREILSQERSMSAAKDAAVMAFLQKISDQHTLAGVSSGIPLHHPALHITQEAQFPQQPPHPLPPSTTKTTASSQKSDDRHENPSLSSTLRWPKAEVQALIKLRFNFDSKYQENAPKGPLWEEISSAMRAIGYNRNAKRCKEKWENINKYFKKMKENNRFSPQDSKTSPYFLQLHALYQEKSKAFDGSSSTSLQSRPENTAPLLVQPEQQWPPPSPAKQARGGSTEEHAQGDQEDDEEKDNEDDGEYQFFTRTASKLA